MQQEISDCVVLNGNETLLLKEKPGYNQDWKFQLCKFDIFVNFVKQAYLNETDKLFIRSSSFRQQVASSILPNH
jgi:hypothetical protein